MFTKADNIFLDSPLYKLFQKVKLYVFIWFLNLKRLISNIEGFFLHIPSLCSVPKLLGFRGQKR